MAIQRESYYYLQECKRLKREKENIHAEAEQGRRTTIKEAFHTAGKDKPTKSKRPKSEEGSPTISRKKPLKSEKSK